MKKSQQNIGSIPLIVSSYLKSLSQEAKDLMDEKEDANSDIEYNTLFLLVVTRKSMPLNFLMFLTVKLHSKRQKLIK